MGDFDSNLTIKNCYATGSVIGIGNTVGGLVGWLSSVTMSNLSNSYAICEVAGTTEVGGLVGIGGSYGSYGIIDKSYAGGNVQCTSWAGGLIGYLSIGTYLDITDCYATGNITGIGASNTFIGGLVGCSYSGNNNNIIDCYAIGNITGIGGTNIGGLVGICYYGTLKNCVAANAIVEGGISNVNCIVGNNIGGVLSNNYAYEDMLVNGSTVVGGTHNNDNGESTHRDTLMSFNFYNTGSNWYNNIPWDIDAAQNSSKIWQICDSETLPFLQWEGLSCGKKVPYIEQYKEDYTAVQNRNHLLTIYPNPVSYMVTISATDEMQQLEVFDITGRLVKNLTLASEQVSFDTSIFPIGIYIVQARLKEGGVQRGKLVVKKH